MHSNTKERTLIWLYRLMRFQNPVNIHLFTNALPIVIPSHHQTACYLIDVV